MVKTSKNAAKRCPIPLTDGEVIRLLRAAHRRRTGNSRWLDNPERIGDLSLEQLVALSSLAKNLNDIAAAMQERPVPQNLAAIAKLTGDGQKAVNELRHVLPVYIEHLRQEMERGPNTLLRVVLSAGPAFEQEWRKEQAQTIQAYALMLSTLLDLAPRNPRHRLSRYRSHMHSWQSSAIEIYELFEKVMGKASTSRDGPAVHFVKAILVRMGRRANEAAVEQLLRRSKQTLAKERAERTAAFASMTEQYARPNTTNENTGQS